MAIRCGQKYIRPKRCTKTNRGQVCKNNGVSNNCNIKKDVSNVTNGMSKTKKWVSILFATGSIYREPELDDYLVPRPRRITSAIF